MKIWLDDKKSPPNNSWIWIETPVEFILEIAFQMENGQMESVEEISFDHDLGILYAYERNGETFAEISGYVCLQWLILTYKILNIPLPRLSCHSQNPVGRERIERLISEVQR